MGRLLAGVRRVVERAPLEYVEWLPPQLEYLQAADRRVLLRAGNQAIGKSTVGLADWAWWARGEHPFREAPRRPVQSWIVSSSEQQSGQLAAKFCALVPPAWLHPDTPYIPAKGHFRGKYPKVGLRHVSGGWSWIHWRWTGQRSLNLAGATLQGVLFDEPPASQRAFREVERRLTRTGGIMRLTFTPVNAPVEYIRELADEGQIRDLHYTLQPEHLIPVGRDRPLRTEDGTPMDAAWIAEQRSLVAEWEAPVILDGEWEFRTVGQVFTAWDPGRHTVRNIASSPTFPRHDVWHVLGIDYGDGEHRQVGVLAVVDDRGRHPRVWVLDEYVSDGRSTTEMDAKAVLKMLRRNGLKWSDLDYVHGDKRYTGRRFDLTTKSNREMQKAIAHELDLNPKTLRPPIHSAKRGPRAGAHSKITGARWLHERMVLDDAFLVDTRCTTLIECLGRWDWGEQWKDPIDGLRYALKPWILSTLRTERATTLRVT